MASRQSTNDFGILVEVARSDAKQLKHECLKVTDTCWRMSACESRKGRRDPLDENAARLSCI